MSEMKSSTSSCCTRLKTGVIPKPSWKRKLSLLDSYEEPKSARKKISQIIKNIDKDNCLNLEVPGADVKDNKKILKDCYVKLTKLDGAVQNVYDSVAKPKDKKLNYLNQDIEDPSTTKTIGHLIDSLYEKNLIDKETFEVLMPFKDVKYSVIEHEDESSEEYEKVYELSNLLYSKSEEAYGYLKSIIPLPNIAISPTKDKCTTPSCLKRIINEMFPSATNIGSVDSSLSLTDLFIETNMILKGTHFLVEKQANFPLCNLMDRIPGEECSTKIINFCKIILMNSPQAYSCLSKFFSLPDMKQLFATIGPDIPNTITLGQMIQEASAQGVVTDSVAKKLIKYHDCHLTPFASSTVNDNGQAISCIYFNSLPLFNYLTQYLPLPNIVLVPKFNPSKSGDVAKSPTVSRNLINDDDVTLGNHKNSSGKDEKCQVAQTIENSQEQFYDDFSDQFFMGLCPKTGKNIMKMQVDMEGFLPNELSVKVVGSTLTISGCKEDEIQKIEFMRNVVLPSYVDSDQAGCYYFKGCMAIHAPISNLEAANQAQQNQVKLSSKKQSFITITQKKSSQNYNENLSNQLTDSSFENADNSSGSVTSKKTNGNNHKSVVSSKNTVHTNIPFNVAVLVNVEGHEYISLVVEVSKLFKPNEIVVKVRENKVVSVTGETRSTDESKKSRLYAFIEREFDLPKKIDRKTLKAGCTGDGLLKIFARVAT